MLYFLARFLLVAPFVWVFRTPRIVNREKLKIKGGAILVSNHWSAADPVKLGIICPRFIHFMAKKELFSSKFKDFFFRKLLLVFPVDRDNPDLQSLKTAISMIRNNKMFGIFPEGRRSVTGDMDKFEKGAAFLALKTGAPVIPVYSDPNSQKTHRYHMVVGDPIYADQITAQYKGKSIEVVTRAIEDSMHQLRIQCEADEI